MFTIPEGQSFWQSFSNQVFHFKELTKNMPEEKVFSLMSDPAIQGNESYYYFTIIYNKQIDLQFLIR